MWNLDRSHVSRPATLICQHIQTTATGKGTRRGFGEIGVPLYIVSCVVIDLLGVAVVYVFAVLTGTRARWRRSLAG